jgi:microcystin-dependent protein
MGEIRMFSGNFAPRGWRLCNGDILPISQYTPLFAVIGIAYGGNGQTTFALPDLRGRIPMHWGQGPGLSPRVIGERAGSETVTLISTQMPAHNHTLNASFNLGAASSPEGAFVAAFDPTFTNYAMNANTTMNPASIGIAGGSQPHQNMQPSLAISFIIALEGIFPSRN